MWMGLFPSVEGLTRTKDWLPLSKKEFCQQKGLWALYPVQGSQRTRTNVICEAVWGDLLWGLTHVIMRELTSPWYVIAPGKLMVRTQFRIPENKLQSSVSAGKRRCRFQLKKSERIHLPLPFILFVPQWMGCYWSTLVGHFVYSLDWFKPLSLPEMLTDTSRNTFHQLSNNPLAQSGWYIRLTISRLELKHWVFLGLSPSAALLYRFWNFQTP